jgi:hypothetical protein
VIEIPNRYLEREMALLSLMDTVVDSAHSMHTVLPRKLSVLTIPNTSVEENPFLHFDSPVTHEEASAFLQLALHRFSGDMESFVNYCSSIICQVFLHFSFVKNTMENYSKPTFFHHFLFTCLFSIVFCSFVVSLFFSFFV